MPIDRVRLPLLNFCHLVHKARMPVEDGPAGVERNRLIAHGALRTSSCSRPRRFRPGFAFGSTFESASGSTPGLFFSSSSESAFALTLSLELALPLEFALPLGPKQRLIPLQ